MESMYRGALSALFNIKAPMKFCFLLLLALCIWATGCQTFHQVELLPNDDSDAGVLHAKLAPSEIEIATRIIDDFAKENGFAINKEVTPSTNSWRSYYLLDQQHAYKAPKVFLSLGRSPDSKSISVTILDNPPQAHVQLARSLTKKLKEKLISTFGSERVRMKRKGVYDPTWLGALPTIRPKEIAIC